MTIVCDFDNILNDLTAKTIEMYNRIYSKEIKMSDATAYDFHDCFPDDADGLIELFQEKELWESLEPLPDSQWGLMTLVRGGHDVYIATATHYNNFAWKIDWFKKYFPFIDEENIMCIHNKSLLKTDVIIDDNLWHLIHNVCERITLDYPWNRSSAKDYAYNILRCNNWTDIVNTINKIERKDKEWERG